MNKGTAAEALMGRRLKRHRTAAEALGDGTSSVGWDGGSSVASTLQMPLKVGLFRLDRFQEGFYRFDSTERRNRLVVPSARTGTVPSSVKSEAKDYRGLLAW